MVLFPNIHLDFLIGGFGFGSSSIQLIQIQVDLYGVIRFLLGQKDNRLHMLRHRKVIVRLHLYCLIPIILHIFYVFS